MMADFFQELRSNKLTTANLILLLTLFANQVTWQTKTGVTQEVLRKATDDLKVETSYKLRSEQFVPRKEAEAHWKSIQNSLIRIEKKLDRER